MKNLSAHEARWQEVLGQGWIALILWAYAKLFQQGKVPKTVHLSTARRLNAAGAVLR